MNDLKSLESLRLIKELQFVEFDFLYLEELIKINQSLFMNEVNLLVGSIPELNDYKSSEPKEEIEIQDDLTELKIHVKENIEDPNIRNLYRQIVKKTHPDKSANLDDIYIEATKAYENKDLSTIIKISCDLNIPFEWTDDIRKEITDKISEFKIKRNFLENSYVYKWMKSEEPIKKLILIEYLKNRMLV